MSISDVWVMSICRRRGMRSATTPAHNMNSQVGMPAAKPTYPRNSGDFVSSKTRKPRAVDCIQLPNSEVSWPPNHNR